MNTHKHKCPECGTIWEHSNRCHGSDIAHKCPRRGCTGSETLILQPGFFYTTLTAMLPATYRATNCMILAKPVSTSIRRPRKKLAKK